MLFIESFSLLLKFTKYVIMGRRCKDINLYLMDIDVGGRIKCAFSNWTAAYKIPRTELDRYNDCSNKD